MGIRIFHGFSYIQSTIVIVVIAVIIIIIIVIIVHFLVIFKAVGSMACRNQHQLQ
jgi:ABC-type multidrug transport system permease subunit